MTAYLVAAAVAASVLLGELLLVKHVWFVARSTFWWGGILAIEGMAGAFAVALLKAITALQVAGDVDGLLTWILAGIAAPRLVKATLPMGPHNINLAAHAYDRLRKPFEHEIDDASGDAKAQWIEKAVLPAVRSKRITAKEVGDAFEHNLHGRSLMAKADRAAALSFVAKVLADDVPDEEKVGTLVLRAQELGTYRSMRRLVDNLPKR